MSKEDLIQFDGKVVNASGGGTFLILLDNGHQIAAKLSGKIKKFKIKIIVGDRVTVSTSPYDPTHGLITFRHKTLKNGTSIKEEL